LKAFQRFQRVGITLPIPSFLKCCKCIRTQLRMPTNVLRLKFIENAHRRKNQLRKKNFAMLSSKNTKCDTKKRISFTSFFSFPCMCAVQYIYKGISVEQFGLVRSYIWFSDKVQLSLLKIKSKSLFCKMPINCTLLYP
jgi:hypothetical protein